MSLETEQVGEVYVYGLVAADVDPPEGVPGVAGSAVERRDLGDGVVALVSEVDVEMLGAADDLLAHAAVLDGLAERTTVVPFAFGSFTDPEDDETAAALAAGYHRVAPRLDGAVQLTVTARYVEDAVLAELVEEDPEIAALRRRTAGSGPDELRNEKMRLGELVVQGLERKAEADARPILAALEGAAREVAVHERRSADDVIELAALVDRDGAAAFEDVAERLAEQRAGRIRIRLVGPQAPFDFVGEG
jgi:hypothetical protein